MAKLKLRAPWSFERSSKKAETEAPESRPTKGTVPSTRQSRPTLTNYFTDIKGKTIFVNPQFIAEYIPVIRKLSWIDGDMGLAVNDMVRLTNTGHKIKFDPSVPPEMQKKMKQHIANKQIEWGDGVDGMFGLVNKLIAQIWISGAISGEWVVSRDKKGVGNLALVNPETIVFSWNPSTMRYEPYQKQVYSVEPGKYVPEKMVKLNENTYRYYGINGDTELPYGIPPFLTALEDLVTKGDMKKNIKYIIKQLGLLGFFETLMDKPEQLDGENDDQYAARLKKFLNDSKEEIIEGISEGVIVGFKDEHEFKFNSTTKDLRGVGDLYNLNQRQVANGLKFAPEFLGVGSKGTETGISIVFTKMLSQLNNVQQTVSAFLRFGYNLELRLAGYTFENLTVEFNPSTITDELKYQQGLEIKIRNVDAKYASGVISQQQRAEELGYDEPDEQEPRIMPDKQAELDQKREKDKDASDRKSREKDKPQPKRKDQKSQAAEFLVDLFLDYLANDNNNTTVTK